MISGNKKPNCLKSEKEDNKNIINTKNAIANRKFLEFLNKIIIQIFSTK